MLSSLVFIGVALPIIVLLSMISFFVLVGMALYDSGSVSKSSYVTLPNEISSVEEENS